MSEDQWLLVKNGLYYRQNDCGYTGIRDHAGIYSGDEALARASNGVTRVRLEHAPEFSEACFDDLARDHLRRKRDQLLAALAAIKSLVVGDKNPCWQEEYRVTLTRAQIADICDSVL